MLTPQQIAKIRQDAGAPAAPVSPSSTTGMSLSQKTAVAPQQTTPTNVNAEHATFPATGNESPLGIAAHTIGNIPSSAIGFGKSVIDFLNPLNTVKTAQNIGETINSIQQDKGGADVSALDVAKEAVAPGGDIRQGQAFKAVVPQFLQHIFQGDVTKAAATIENDPVGQLAPLIMVARGAAQKMGKGAEFDSAMSTIAKPVTATGKAAANAAGNVAAQTLGATTGTGASTIKAAAEGTPEFTQAMRGKISPEDVVNSAKGVVQNIKTNRSSAYIEDLKKVGEDQTSHDITSVVDEVPKQLKNFGVKVGENGELDFSRSSIANNGSARADIQGVYDTVKDWGKQRGDRTGIGLDTLKKQLGDFYSDSGQARAFVQAVKSKVDNILQTQVPGYKEMTGKYAKASGLLEDIKSATAIGGKANADTVFTKLVTAMKGDKEFRLEVLKEMEASGDPRLMDKIAGVNMQSLIPKGLIGRGVDVITAYQVLQGTFSAKFLPMLLATSPRVVGEFVRALGLGAQKTKSVLDAINKLPDDCSIGQGINGPER